MGADGGLTIEHGNGTLESVFVHPKCHTDEVALKLARRRSGDEPNEWKDNAGYTYRSGYSKFTGKYNIPSDPRSGGQILYYFIGMENTGGGPVNILQPVLGWHGNGWDWPLGLAAQATFQQLHAQSVVYKQGRQPMVPWNALMD